MARKLFCPELVIQGTETTVPFSALPEIHGVFLPVLSTAFLSTLSASNCLFQDGSVYYSSVFGVFLVSSPHEKGIFLFLQPEHVSCPDLLRPSKLYHQILSSQHICRS